MTVFEVITLLTFWKGLTTFQLHRVPQIDSTYKYSEIFHKMGCNVFKMEVVQVSPVLQIDVLSEVVEAVEGELEVYMDGGVRCGSDVFKALAMGARAVFIGRPVLWGLAYSGQEGVERVLELIRDEFQMTMKLAGNTLRSRVHYTDTSVGFWVVLS